MVAHCVVPASTEPTRKIVTNYWRKPIPTDKFDWSAHFDDDEPNDDGRMVQGYGATEAAAIADLMIEAEMDE